MRPERKIPASGQKKAVPDLGTADQTSALVVREAPAGAGASGAAPEDAVASAVWEAVGVLAVVPGTTTR